MEGFSGLNQKRGGKKTLAFELNLVPFIDLFTCLICFLLLSAMWVSTQQISIVLAGFGPGSVANQKTNVLTLIADSRGFQLSLNDKIISDIPKKGSRYDYSALGAALGSLRRDPIHGNDLRATMRIDDSVPYQSFIDLLDICHANDIEDVSVAVLS